MDNTTSPTQTNPASTAAFPMSNGEAGATSPAASTTPDHSAGGTATVDKVADAAAAAAPVMDRLIKQATTSAHDAIDSLASKASSLAGGLQGGVSKVGDTRDEWLESARDAIRQHPFATVAGALVIGAALLSLASSRRD